MYCYISIFLFCSFPIELLSSTILLFLEALTFLHRLKKGARQRLRIQYIQERWFVFHQLRTEQSQFPSHLEIQELG